jgi:hypothetical protein
MAVFSLKPSASCLKKAVIACAILLISAQAQAEPGSGGRFVGLSGHWSAESERPLLTLVGTAIAKIQNVAVVFNPGMNEGSADSICTPLRQLHVDGWTANAMSIAAYLN